MKHRGKIHSFIKDYKFNSLFLKNLILLLLLILIPLSGAAVLGYYTYGNMQKNELRDYSEKITADIYSDLKMVLKEAETELIYIGFNSNIELFMYETDEIKQLHYRLYSLLELLRLPVISKDHIKSIYLYSFNSNKVLSTYGITDYDNFIERECFEAYLKGSEKGKNLQVTTYEENNNFYKQLSFFQEIRYGANSNGVAVMNLDLKELSKKLRIPEGGSVFLTNGTTILFSNVEEWIGKTVSEIPGAGSMVKDESFIGGDYIISNKTTESEDLELIIYLSMENYQDQLSTIRSVIFTFLLIMGVITLMLSALISIRIFQPIESIIEAIKRNQEVLMGEKDLFQERDELGYILHSIQKTTNIRKDIDRELSERVKFLKKAQAVALQSQINPHFLNNTLDTVNWMAIGLLGGKNEISEMTGALSKMLRMTLENTDSIVPISQEIEHCMYYLEIQNKRYEDKFQVNWKVPQEIYDYKTIRIILQPIVENAIYHGIKHLSSHGLITIGGKLNGETVELTVEDNGLGMTEQELEILRNNMKSDMIKESRHIGIANVNQRINLYFGEEYGVIIESTEGVGTKVILKFPMIRN